MRSKLRWLRNVSVMFVASLAVIALAISGCESFGARPDGARLIRLKQSTEWQGNNFENPQAMWRNVSDMLLHAFNGGPELEPVSAVPVTRTDPAALAILAPTGLRVTWFGHSSTLIEIDGKRVLTDPIWSDRASPVEWVGPHRWYPPTIALAQLPTIDAVLLSHDHYDHLDFATIAAMRAWKNVFIVPLGLGAHLERWGIPSSRIVELDWWQSTHVGHIEITLTPARHASGRINPQSDIVLWGGFALVGKLHRAYYSGDTGLFDAMTEIGERLGPFDVALIEAGQYDADWPDWHLGPEQAVLAARRVGAKTLIPVHWGLFRLAHHGWTEPVERVLASARCTDIKVLTPRPGQSIEPTTPRPGDADHWWPETAWTTAAQNPIIATIDGVKTHRVSLAPCPSVDQTQNSQKDATKKSEKGAAR